jgi:hypothetical protein
MPGLARATADAVLKEFYLPGIRDILNNTFFLLSQLDQNTEDVEGRRAVLSVHTGRNQGIGARGENETLPTAGYQGYSEERVPLKYNYGRIQLSGPVMRAMGSDRGSFTRALQSESDGVVKDLRNDVNRQLYGTSDGVIATVTSGAGQVLTLTTPTATQLRQLQVGMLIDIGTAANPVARSQGVTISAVNTAAGTVTVVGTVGTISAGDLIFRAGSQGGGSYGAVGQREMTGLQTQINNSGVLWNIDPTNAPNWVSFVNNTGGTVAEDMFIQAMQEVNIASGEEINLWVTDSITHRKVAALMTSLKRFPVPVELHGGYTGLDMSAVGQGNSGANTVTMVFDKDCPAKTAFGITTKRFRWYKASDWEFMDEDGSVLNRVPNTDAYEGTLFLYSEIATDGRNAHCRINNLT